MELLAFADDCNLGEKFSFLYTIDSSTSWIDSANNKQEANDDVMM